LGNLTSLKDAKITSDIGLLLLREIGDRFDVIAQIGGRLEHVGRIPIPKPDI
jgi:hypothetical protein